MTRDRRDEDRPLQAPEPSKNDEAKRAGLTRIPYRKPEIEELSRWDYTVGASMYWW